MSTTPAVPQEDDQPELPDNVVLADAEVNLAGVHRNLMGLLKDLGAAHKVLFVRALVVTAGRDKQHVPGSKHYKGLAVDVRSRDKSDAENLVFLLVLAHLARLYKVAVFDERARETQPHFHLEVAE